MPTEPGPVVPAPSDAAAVLALRRALTRAGSGVAADPDRCRRVLADLLPAEPELAAALVAVVAAGLPAQAARARSAAELRAVTARALRAVVDGDAVPEPVAQRAIGCWIAVQDAGPDAPATRLRPAAGLLTGPTTIVPLPGRRTTARVAARPATARAVPPWWAGRRVQIAAAAIVVGTVMTGSTLLLSAVRGTAAADRLAAAVVPVHPPTRSAAAPSTPSTSPASPAPLLTRPDAGRSRHAGSSMTVTFRSPAPTETPSGASGPAPSAPPAGTVVPPSGSATVSAPPPASTAPTTAPSPTTTAPSSAPPSSDPPTSSAPPTSEPVSTDPPTSDPPSSDPPTSEPSPTDPTSDPAPTDPVTASPDATDPVPSSATAVPATGAPTG